MPPRTPKAAAKPAASRKKATPKSAAPAPTEAAEDASPLSEKPAKSGLAPLRLKELVGQIAAAADLKKPDAKRAVEATLSALAGALAERRDLSLPPLGKLRVARSNGVALTLKLRPAGSGKAAAKALAEDGEDD